MNPITVSLATAEKMRDAGWEGRNIFCWFEPNVTTCGIKGLPIVGISPKVPKCDMIAYAPTASEILDRLPNNIDVDDKIACLEILSDRDFPTDEEWIVCYSFGKNCDNKHWVKSKDGLANAVAKMWLHLKENNLLPTQSDEYI